MDGYCYNVNNKKGKAVDFWIMDKPTPKEANFIFSCRFSRYVKPKSKPIEKMFDDALNQELKSQMPSEQIAWEQGYEAGLAQGKQNRPQGEWISVKDKLPDKEGRCLVFTDYGDVTMDSFVDGMFVCNLGNVTHWRPLPHKPESEV